jgi:hypothetical protein
LEDAMGADLIYGRIWQLDWEFFSKDTSGMFD